MAASRYGPPHLSPQRRGHISSPKKNNKKQQHTASRKQKLSLSMVIRALYWGMFLLLFVSTFLRTSIDTSNATTTSNMAPSVDHDPPRHTRMNHQQRAPVVPKLRRMGHELEDTDDATAATLNGVLPGLHNPTVEKFHQDVGKHIPDEQFFSKTIGKSSGAAQSNSDIPLENIVSNTNKNLYDHEQKVDWRTFLQKGYHRQQPSPRDLGPRSPFVQRLLTLEEELMSKANSTEVNLASKPEDWRINLAKTPPDQPIDFVTPILPSPKFHDSKVVVLVLSHQGSFIKRQAIRETWAKNYSSNVLFVVAQSDCSEFEHDLNAVTYVDDNGKEVPKINQQISKANTTTSRCDGIDHNFLRLEQEKYQDLLEIPMKEKYSRLPEKLLQAYHWVLKNVPSVEWVVKSDDDMFVRVANLEQYLKKYNSEIPMVIGEIIYHSKVNPIGKWAELDYPYEYYPFWPKGSAGHVLSRASVKYISDNSESLYRYQGEDTSIGIWLDEAQKSKKLQDVTYIHSKNMFASHGKNACMSPKAMIIGHDLRPDQLLTCHLNHTYSFTEKAWLDDPSQFEDIIRQEMGDNTNPIAMKWLPAVEYKRGSDTQGLANIGSQSFGLRGTTTKP